MVGQVMRKITPEFRLFFDLIDSHGIPKSVLM